MRNQARIDYNINTIIIKGAKGRLANIKMRPKANPSKLGDIYPTGIFIKPASYKQLLATVKSESDSDSNEDFNNNDKKAIKALYNNNKLLDIIEYLKQ